VDAVSPTRLALVRLLESVLFTNMLLHVVRAGKVPWTTLPSARECLVVGLLAGWDEGSVEQRRREVRVLRRGRVNGTCTLVGLVVSHVVRLSWLSC
jgi:hypothetical protein